MDKKKTALTASLLCALTAVASVGSGGMHPTWTPPSMVVMVVVDGLSEADVAFAPAGSALHRIGSAVAVPNVDYKGAYGLAAHAMLVTGAPPSINGISAATQTDRDTGRPGSVYTDADFIGNFTSETLSPKALKTSTVADELKIGSRGNSHVYSLAAEPEHAITAAGHSAGAALWINPVDGRWATSTYYKDVPAEVTRVNYKTPLSSRIDTMTWVVNAAAPSPLRYFFPSRQPDSYRRMRVSPKGNDEVTDMACSLIAGLAKKREPGAADMISVVYTVAEYPYGISSTTLAAEREDAVRRLDSQIGRLLKEIEKNGASDRTLVCVAGLPSKTLTRPGDERWNLPTGEFSPRRAKALLNMYLMALHGNGDWVRSVTADGVYLNIPSTVADASALRRDAALFMKKMSGVADAVSSDDALLGKEKFLLDPATAPDILFSVAPGWKLVETGDALTEGKIVREVSTAAPVYILYPSIPSTVVAAPVDAEAIAPTLSRLMRIRAPNASSTPPLIF